MIMLSYATTLESRKVVVTRGGRLLATTHTNGKTVEGAWLLMRA